LYHAYHGAEFRAVLLSMLGISKALALINHKAVQANHLKAVLENPLMLVNKIPSDFSLLHSFS